MSELPCKVLIFDWDENLLIVLQHVLQNAGVDTTVTWDEAEARALVKNTRFDVILVGDHPPDVTAEKIFHDSSLRGAACRCLILRTNVGEKDTEQFRRFGIAGVVPKRDTARVLQQVQEHWQSKESDTTSKRDSNVGASLRAAA